MYAEENNYPENNAYNYIIAFIHQHILSGHKIQFNIAAKDY